jgi:aspartyl-tRNA(Asn)/glutamyl-tRNA(Gln) amidotransferase subunit B
MSTQYETVIGLEVHAQVLSKTKIFCGCPTDFGAEPNHHVCPVCLALPGVLPVLNKKAVEYTIRTGLATHCTINEYSVFARKNYFYPDLPKGYQISQFDLPVCLAGYLDIPVEGGQKRVGITRIHMEEDAGKNIHGAGSDRSSYVDLNRAGVPLMEIVSEPDMRSAYEASAYLRKLRNILVYLGVCDGNMEEGSFRCDANVSIRPLGQKEFGTRAELKNLNSFRYVEQAIEYEVERQKEILESGGKVIQETRLFDPGTGQSRSMRSKEEAHDYRYFPDPDLLPLRISRTWIEEIGASLPELAEEKSARFHREYEIPVYDADVLTQEREVADYFEQAVKAYGGSPKMVSNWMMTELLRELKLREKAIADCAIPPGNLAGLLKLIDNNTLSGKMAKSVFMDMFESGQSAEIIVKDKGLAQVSDEGAIVQAIDGILDANPAEVKRYLDGNEKLLAFFVGQVMAATKGKANPGMANKLVKEQLEKRR